MFNQIGIIVQINCHRRAWGATRKAFATPWELCCCVMPKKPCIRDFIGYGKRFNPNIGTTAEIMKELREGRM